MRLLAAVLYFALALGVLAGSLVFAVFSPVVGIPLLAVLSALAARDLPRRILNEEGRSI